MSRNKYQNIFDHAPVALMELDYSALRDLRKTLQQHTVTNIRQYLGEHQQIVKKTFHAVKVNDANKSAHVLFNTRSKGQILSKLSKVMTTSALDGLTEQFVSLLEGETEFRGEFKYKTRQGTYRDIFMTVSLPNSGTKALNSVLVALQDITIWKRVERQLRKRAQLDGLTDLYNHTTISQRLEEELIRAKRYGLSLSCMMVDLDHFKVINDKFGHQRGDQVLKKVAQMIKNCVRKSDIVGRYGGDEFIVILPETKAEFARFAAERVHRLFSDKEFRYQRMITFHISLSIGITGYPSKKIKESKDFVALADRAMYQAKKAGRNRTSIL